MGKMLGRQSIEFDKPCYVTGTGTVVGSVEGKGPLSQNFDTVLTDALWAETSWEKSERKMFREAVTLAIQKSGLDAHKINVLLGGDLLNQIISASFAARELGIPFLGQYGACSTMAQTLLTGAMILESGCAENVACAASSHYATAERQYRLPLEMGGQHTPASQRTVTGAGSCVLQASPAPASPATGQGSNVPRVTCATIGTVIDWGVEDANNMGAAMAPAAAMTISQHFSDTGRGPDYYDVIVTGDLGTLGRDICNDLMIQRGFDIQGKYIDCGCEIFTPSKDIPCGGSGCGCSAVVLLSYIYKRLIERQYKKILFVATGALLSPTTSLQKETIPGIAHAVALEMEES